MSVKAVPYGACVGAFSPKPSQVASTPKILAGLDVRTTPVLRSIPNKLTGSDLRIDFSRFGCAGVT